MAVGTVTYTEETLRIYGQIKKIKAAWTCTAGGAASGTLTDNIYSGEIIRLVTVPATAGDAPTDNYDVTLVDEDGTDVLMGSGVDRDTANTEQVLASSLGCVANDKLELRVANAGATKQGVVYIYIR